MAELRRISNSIRKRVTFDASKIRSICHISVIEEPTVQVWSVDDFSCSGSLVDTPPFAVGDAWRYWMSTIRPLREVFFHYTDTDALLSIIETRRMWATDLLFMNDPKELTYGAKLIEDALEQSIQTCHGHAARCEWLAAFKTTTRDQLGRNAWYSISFCEDYDLLSQWRTYGANGGGFALGWKTLSTYPERPIPIGVQYDRTTQLDILRNLISIHLAYVSGFDEIFADDAHSRLAHATESLATLLWVSLFSFKDSAFESEKEFRWVYPAFDGETSFDKPLRFRRFGSIVKPFFEADFSKADLVEIVYGPTANPGLTDKWLRMALDANGFTETRITPSRIVLR